MRYFVFIALLLLSSASLFSASYYKSNSLMQRLEEIDELTFSGYELQVLDNKEILLLNNEEIKKRVISDSVEVTRENNVTYFNFIFY